MNIYKSAELESTFIEIINDKKSKIIVGCIYRHPAMDLNEFNDYYLNELLHKLFSENKSVILLGDFNVDLMKYDNHHSTNEFLDSLPSHLFLPHITQPAIITDTTKTLFDNIFSNTLIENTISGNLTATISDHLPQFIVLPNIFCNPPSNKSNIYERDWCNFVQENFILDYFSVDWNSLINNDKDVNLSFNNFFKRINAILDNHAPLMKVGEKNLRFRTKAWITLSLQKSISIKNILFAKFIKSNDINQRNEMHIKYKQYRNLISTFLKRSKCLYFINFFNDNLNNLKNTWKGIKNLISLKNVSHSFPSSIYYNNKTVTSPFEIANAFKNCFSNIALDIQSSIKYFAKEFYEFPPPLSIKSFFSLTYR